MADMKTQLLPLLAGLLLLSCNSQPDQPVSMQSQEQNVALARKVYEHFNKHEWEKMAGLYTEPAEFKDPSFGQGIVKQTREQTARKYSEMEGKSPDVRDDITAIYPSGDNHVIVEFVSSGTAPDGTKWQLPICTIFTMENGQITKDFTYYDNPPEQ
jgi:ketosteroid isomerase-like protein